MGIVNCSKHGGTGFWETCAHVGAEFGQGNYPQFHQLTFHENVVVCDRCWEQYDLARFESHPDIAGKLIYDTNENKPMVKEYFRLYEIINAQSQCWCTKCIAEIRAKVGTPWAEGPE
jgi:hypothetical protein